MKVSILSIVYDEPYWSKTECIIEELSIKRGYDVVYVRRNPHGHGSLSEAINRGIKLVPSYNKYVWIITNVTFKPEIIDPMLEAMEEHNLAAIHPAMNNSDHLFKRQNGKNMIMEVPYIEFTAPLVRLDIMREFPLNEDMPYWGHDLAWGHEVREAGYIIAVDHSVTVEHDYIRNNFRNHSVTTARMKARQATNQSTIEKLVQLYGTDWKQVLKYEG